ncbi:hypothetical protein BS78_K293500 [Paspalum vaginatum]|uniref:Uncharacterized protein n=1 Tax=Paspalum vaginatum TaxID=158149 RepID=A0A9W7X847_9POAL|nr:hypothetical protein BS78_K293500 [Paspalum vaginatum]
MASRIALLCLLGLVVASPAVADYSGSYYKLSLMWPGAYCEQTKAGCCKPTTGVSPARDFYITGFAVYNATTQCSNAPFDINEIIDLPGLLQYWSNIKCPGNDGRSSWKKAWKNSGRCSGLEQKDYFETALALRSRLNPLVRLKHAGIEPDMGMYSVEEIKRVFQTEIDAAPLIQCSKGSLGKFQLFQLYFCAVAENGTFIDCPTAPAYTCSDEILFPPFEKWMLKQQQIKYAALYDPMMPAAVAMDH